MSHVRVSVMWDPEVQVFCANSPDVSGFNIEAETMPELIQEIEEILPEMMRENGLKVDKSIEYRIQMSYEGVAHAVEA